ncbi:MAG: CsgG/HfaB family protein [Treponema sp.]|jgi:hypothetical protein|nr:CsgG/HfaB family protein [Treponema sp.]
MKGRTIGSLFLLIAAALTACTGGPVPAARETGTRETGAPEAGGRESGALAGETQGEASRIAPSLTEALRESCAELTGGIPGPASIAVIGIASGDPGEAEYALEESIFFLVNLKKYTIVDRRSLDVIRAEQNFQLSGEVDDDTAVFIGHLTGAQIVITGSVSPYGALNYVRMKALDVETGRILAVSSVPFN